MIYDSNVVICEEAIFDKSHKNPVYIVLMHSGTALANIIKKVTGDEFSHACISFNSKLDPLYSFGTKGKGESGVGFAVNDPKDNFFKTHDARYDVYVMYVTDKALQAMKDTLLYFESNKNKLKYDFVGLFNIWFGKDSENHEKWFCSRFVMELISKAHQLPKVPSLWKPSDIADLDNISLVNRGFNLYNYDYKVTDRHCADIKKGKYNGSSVLFENSYTDYMTGKSVEEAENIYISRYSLFRPSFDIPRWIDTTKLEQIAFDKSNSIYKFSVKDSNRDYPFKFFNILDIPQTELTNLVRTPTSRGLSTLSVKVYQYNFEKNKKRISLLLITVKNDIISAYIIGSDKLYKLDLPKSINEAISSKVVKDYESKQDISISQFSKMNLNDAVIQIYKSQYSSLSHIRINKDTKGYIWLDDKKVVAIINVEEKDDNNKWIQAFEIFGDYKGHGLSKQILRLSIKDLGVTHLSVNKDNEVAIKLYKSMGFKIYKTTDSMYFMSVNKSDYEDIEESFFNKIDQDTMKKISNEVLSILKPIVNKYKNVPTIKNNKASLITKLDKMDFTKNTISFIICDDSQDVRIKISPVLKDICNTAENNEYIKNTCKKIHTGDGDEGCIYFILKSNAITEACKNISTARKFVTDVQKIAKKYDANFFMVTDGASGYSNGNGGSNPAVKNARNCQIEWEKKYGFDPDEDWSKNESASEVLDKTVSILKDNGFDPNVDAKSKAKFLAGEETDFGKSLCIANLGSKNLSSICSSINKEIKPIGGKVKPDNYGTIFLSVIESTTYDPMADRYIQDPFTSEDYKMTAKMAQHKLQQLQKEQKLLCCQIKDIYYNGDYVFAEYSLNSDKDKEELIEFTKFINKIIETSIYCGCIDPNDIPSGILSIKEKSVYDIQESTKFYKNPAQQLKRKNTIKKNDQIRTGNYNIDPAPPTQNTSSKTNDNELVEEQSIEKELEKAAKDAHSLLCKEIFACRDCAYVYDDVMMPYAKDNSYAIIKWNLSKLKSSDKKQFPQCKSAVFRYCQNKFNDTHKGYLLDMDDNCFYITKK